MAAAFRVTLEYSLKIAEIFWNTFGSEIGGTPLGFPFLILVVKAPRDGMMRVMGFGDPIGDGELQLVSP